MSDFQTPSDWRRSKRGNLWTDWQGMTLCVFRRGEGFRWSIASPGGVQFSHEQCSSEDDAKQSLCEQLEVMEKMF